MYTIGADFADIVSSYNFERAGRYDVKKPGPHFRSANDFAFHPSQDDQMLDHFVKGPMKKPEYTSPNQRLFADVIGNYPYAGYGSDAGVSI